MADELNGHALPVHHTNPFIITIFKMMELHGTLVVTLKIGAFTKLGLFFPVVCFICVLDKNLAEQLYHDKDLSIGLLLLRVT